MRIDTSTTNADAAWFSGEPYESYLKPSWFVEPPPSAEPSRGPLSRLQGRLQRSNRPAVYLLGNCVSDVRYWLGRLIR